MFFSFGINRHGLSFDIDVELKKVLVLSWEGIIDELLIGIILEVEHLEAQKRDGLGNIRLFLIEILLLWIQSLECLSVELLLSLEKLGDNIIDKAES